MRAGALTRAHETNLALNASKLSEGCFAWQIGRGNQRESKSFKKYYFTGFTTKDETLMERPKSF